MSKFLVVLAILTAAAAAGCSSDSSGPADGPPEGYTRYVTTPITVQPGESGMWAQWVSAPLDRDMDLVDVIGTQTAGGHHAVLYSTPEAHEVGYTDTFDNNDQLSIRFLGGVGGEAGTAIPLPPGYVLRVRAGYSLMIQTHYINTTDEPIEGTAVLDVKLVEVSPDVEVASAFFHATIHTDVPPGQSAAHISCVLPEDVSLLMYTNHMHKYGTHIETRQVLTDGTSHDIKIDPAWNYEWAQNPNFAILPADQPLLLTAGTTLTTDCAWDNTGADTVSFPDEMCIFLGFRIGEGDIVCADGEWINL